MKIARIDQHEFQVHYSDFTTRISPLPGHTEVCSIGHKMVFLCRDSNGNSFTKHSFAAKYGETNVISTDSTRKVYNSQNKVTIITDQAVARAENITRTYGSKIETWVNAVRYGKGDGNYTIVKGSVTTRVTILGFTLYRLDQDSTVTAGKGSYICTDDLLCQETYSTGTFTSEMYIVTGNGSNVYIQSNVTGYSLGAFRILRGERDLFAPSSTTVRAPHPVAIPYPDFIRSGIKSYTYNNFRRDETSRTKRAFGVAIGIASAALSRTRALKSSSLASFKAADQNFNNLKAAFSRQRDQIVELQSNHISNRVNYLRLNTVIKQSQRQYMGVENIVDELSDKGDNIENFALFMLSYRQEAEAVTEDVNQGYLEEVRALHPSGKILEHTLNHVEFFATVMTNGRLTTGNYDPLCSETFCTAKGIWRHWRGHRSLDNVTDPLINTLSCGIYYKDSGNRFQYTASAISDFDTLIDTLTLNQLEYFYVNNRVCQTQDSDLTFSNFWKLNDRLLDLGFEKLKMIDDEYVNINCTVHGPPTELQKKLQSSSYCTNRFHVSRLKEKMAEFSQENVEIISTATVFSKTFKDANNLKGLASLVSEGASEGLKTVAGLGGDIINGLKNGNLEQTNKLATVSIILSGISLALTVAMTFLCLKKRFVDDRNSPSKEMEGVA